MHEQRPRHPRLGLVAWLALAFVPALTMILAHARDWWDEADQPAWALPPIGLEVGWIVMAPLPGVAAWRVWRPRGWTATRFVLLVATTFKFFLHDRIAAALLVLPLLWTLYLLLLELGFLVVQ